MRLFTLAKQARKASREPHWDNVRYLSGTLIVLVHLTAPLLEFTALRWIYIATWTFRVPVFALLAGYFSTAGPLTPRDTRRLVESVLVPYLLLGLVHSAVARAYDGTWVINIANPSETMWFLLALLMWRMMLPFVARLRYPLAISGAVALVVGHIPQVGELFAASQTFAFLPFFVLGWKLREGWGNGLLEATWTRYAAVAAVAGTFAVSWVVVRDVPLTWLGMIHPYRQMPLPSGGLEWALATRGVLLGLGIVLALSFIRLVPKRQIPLMTYLGAGGFYIYLLHPVVLRIWFESGPGVGWVDSRPEQAMLVLSAAVLSAMLASPPVRALTRPIIQPRVPWLFGPASIGAQPPRAERERVEVGQGSSS